MASRKRQRDSGDGKLTAWALASKHRPTPLQPSLTAPVAAELEVAWDGHRVTAAKLGADVRLFADDMREWTAQCQNIALTLRDWSVSNVVLEGTLCVLDEHGRPNFAALKERMASGEGPAPVLMVSDVVVLEGLDLEPLPRPERRARLASTITLTAPLVWSAPLEGALDVVLERARHLGLPGVIAFTLDGPRVGHAISATAAKLEVKRSLSSPPKVTNAAKVLFPRDGVTKSDVIDWYRAIAPVLLPHFRDRPVVAQRWPDGIDDFTWFQHRPPPRAPDYLGSVALDGDRRLLVQNTDALLWMVNQAALTFHTWTTRIHSFTSPDWAVIDLDPGARTTWPEVIEVAIAIRKLLELLEVPSVVKTSGQKGLHVLVPLAPGQTFDDAQKFSLGVSAMVAKLMPAVVCLTHEEKERRGRLFLDHLQNFRGKTLVAPYALRAVDGAPVSTPLDWAEVTPALDPKSFTRTAVLRRVEQFGDHFAAVLTAGSSLGPALARLAGR